VYVRFLGLAPIGEENYSLAVINEANITNLGVDPVVARPSISYGGSANIASDSIAVDESTGKVVIGDGFDQFAHIYFPSTQGFSFYDPGFYPFHVAVDSINGIYYFADGYGDTAYLDEQAFTSGQITSTPNPGNINGTCGGQGSVIGVDATTDQAYITTCDASGANLSLFDGATKKLIVPATPPPPFALSLGTPPNNFGFLSGSFSILVDTSNPDHTKHSAYVENGITNQLDVINGPTPGARPSLSFSPSPLTFGQVNVNSMASVTLTVTNLGPGPLSSLVPTITDSQDLGSIGMSIISCSLPLQSGMGTASS